jgi:PPP family 3-phenylpropionic acid transporter
VKLPHLGISMQQRVRIAGYVALFTGLYAAFGAASPFIPLLIESRGVTPDTLGTIMAVATAARLVASPLAGRLADRYQALRLTLAAALVGTAGAVLGYATAQSVTMLLLVSVLHAMFVAPSASLADALAQREIRRSGPAGFEYGWVRGAGSAAFVGGLVLAGFAVERFGLTAPIVMQAAVLTLVPFTLLLIRAPLPEPAAAQPATPQGVRDLLRLPAFVQLVLVAALVLGSHAMHDNFSVIRWREAGIPASTISQLWALAVASEVLMFVVIGPRLLRSIAPVTVLRIAALIAATRWIISAASVETWAILLVQPLHSITFALLHLAAMRLLASIVPASLAATAQAIYGTVGIGTANVLMTLASGWLIAWTGYASFLAMSALCLAALPLTRALASELSPTRARAPTKPPAT